MESKVVDHWIDISEIEDSVIKDLEKMKVANRNVAEDRRAWKSFIEKVKTSTFEIVVC